MADLVRYDELSHHGTKGMHWGERRYQNKDGSLTALGKMRYGTKTNYEGVKRAKRKVKLDAERAKKAKKKAKIEAEISEIEKKGKKKLAKKGLSEDPPKAKPKSISEMTDDEIIAKTNRLRIENALLQQMPAPTAPKVSKGKQLADSIMDASITAVKQKGSQVIGNYLEKEIKKALGVKPSEMEVLKKEVDKWTNLEKISNAKEKIAQNAASQERRNAKKAEEAAKAKAKAEAQRQVDEYNKSGAHHDSIKGTTYSKSGSSIIQDGPSAERGAKNQPAVTSSTPVSAYTSKSTVVIDGQSFVADILDRNGRIIHGELVNFPDGELYHHGVKGQKWGVRRYQYSDGTLTPAGRKHYQNGGVKGTPEQLGKATPPNTKRLSNYDGPAYFISERKIESGSLTPRVPNNYFTKNGYEDSNTERVCFSDDVGKCLTALSQNNSGKTFYVYSPDDITKYSVFKPNTKAVPDSNITGEMWITEPVKIKEIGTIQCTGDDGKDGKSFKYGDNHAELYGWNYVWSNE